jgi:hypothetical protein
MPAKWLFMWQAIANKDHLNSVLSSGRWVRLALGKEEWLETSRRFSSSLELNVKPGGCYACNHKVMTSLLSIENMLVILIWVSAALKGEERN